jgi:hypothetical protein
MGGNVFKCQLHCPISDDRRIAVMENVSADVAANVKALIEERDWSHSDLGKALVEVTGDEWPDHKLRILTQSKPGVRSHISVDELLALCNAFTCTAYDLLLPRKDSPSAMHRSFSLFGEEVSFPLDQWLHKRSESKDLRYRLQFHPQVSIAVHEPWFSYWLANEALQASSDDSGVAHIKALKAEADAFDNYSMVRTGSINTQAQKMEDDPNLHPPSDSTLERWFSKDRERKAKAIARYNQKQKENS